LWWQVAVFDNGDGRGAVRIVNVIVIVIVVR
jgi:hypothetical protein